VLFLLEFLVTFFPPTQPLNGLRMGMSYFFLSSLKGHLLLFSHPFFVVKDPLTRCGLILYCRTKYYPNGRISSFSFYVLLPPRRSFLYAPASGLDPLAIVCLTVIGPFLLRVT